jgi:hypothetical protein
MTKNLENTSTKVYRLFFTEPFFQDNSNNKNFTLATD